MDLFDTTEASFVDGRFLPRILTRSVSTNDLWLTVFGEMPLFILIILVTSFPVPRIMVSKPSSKGDQLLLVQSNLSGQLQEAANAISLSWECACHLSGVS
jgi:hypothetical protein